MSDQSTQPAQTPPSAQMFQFILGFIPPQAIHVAAKLGIADLVAQAPATVEQLAAATSSDASCLGRVLRFLAGMGIFSEDVSSGKYHQSPLSDTLRSDHPQSVRATAIAFGSEFLWRAFGNLSAGVTNGRPAFNQVFGASFFDYLAAHPSDAAAFNNAMTSVSSMEFPAIIAGYDFSRFERIVDVGGGEGALLAGILAASPKLRGVLFDLPAVVDGARALRNGALAGRYEIVGGNFFEAIPPGADAYVLRVVLHDWNDDDALKILENCRQAIRPGGTLLLIESVLKAPNQPDLARFNDLIMLAVAPGGKERTQAEFASLLRDAKFSLNEVIPATPLTSIIEGVPI